MKKKLVKRKKLLNKTVYTLFGTGVFYAGWQFLSTPRTLQFMEQRRLYAMEAWVLFGLMAIFALVNIHYQIQMSEKETKKRS